MIYTWRFEETGSIVEVQRKFEDIDVHPTCSECHAAGHKWDICEELPCFDEDWERIISKTNFSLSGGGWAKQGYTK
jgi:elongation factor P hydroxylase